MQRWWNKSRRGKGGGGGGGREAYARILEGAMSPFPTKQMLASFTSPVKLQKRIPNGAFV